MLSNFVFFLFNEPFGLFVRATEIGTQHN